MRDFFRWLRRCLKAAPKGVREWADVPATIIGIIGPLLAWIRPAFWNADRGLLIMNALLWMVPCGFAWLYLAVRALVSPYLVYRELETDSQSEQKKLEAGNSLIVAELEKNNVALRQKLDTYEVTPITLELRNTEGDLLIQILVTNHGHMEQRTLDIYMSLSPYDEQITEHHPLYRSKARISAFPHVMAARSSFELTLVESVENLLDFGVTSFHAVLKMEDGRKVVSKVVDISNRQQNEFPLPLTIAESIQRFERITIFVDAYTLLYKALKPTESIDLAMLAKAGITTLEDDDEIRQACDTLLSRNMSHAIDRIYFDRGVKILDFFKVKAAENEDLSGANGIIELLYWRKDGIDPFSEPLYTEEPPDFVI